MYLKEDILALERYIRFADKKVLAISTKSIDWHIYHSLRVINKTCKDLLDSKPEQYRRKFNWWRLIIFTRGKFPDGKAETLNYVFTDETICIKDIYVRLRNASEQLKKIKKLPKNAHINHPYFGMINLKQSVKFLEIHTKYHLKIIKDIKRGS